MAAVALLLTLSLLAVGCVSSLDRTYYLKTYDPHTDTANYFRITLDGDSSLSKTKYSIGFFDRSAVEVLFGESSLRRELERTKLLDAETLDKLDRSAEQLRAAETLVGQSSAQTGALRRLALQLHEVVARFRTRLALDEEMQGQFASALELAKASLLAADIALDATPVGVETAHRRLVEARGTLEALRVAVDGDVLVRFFDGAGNEIDLATQALVIFVASDVSKFSEALRQLAESEVARRNLLLTVLGPRIREEELLENRVEVADSERDRALTRLAEVLAGVEALPGDHQGDEAAKKKALAEDLTKLRQGLKTAAAAAAGKSEAFGSADEIRGFAEALVAEP